MPLIALPRHRAAAVLLSLAAAAGACDKGNRASRSPAGAAAVADAPFLALVPAETPYVMATFEPVPTRYWARFAPLLRSLTDPGLVLADGDAPKAAQILASLGAELGPHFDGKRAVELGLSPEPRVAVYGLGAYPVFRVEIADGDRLFATLERISRASRDRLEPPVRRDGYRVWTFAEGTAPTAAVFAIGKRDAVLAIVPTPEIDAYLPRVLGVERPAQALAPATLRDIARRHGYTAYGVGYLDIEKLARLLMPAELAPACQAAILELTTSAPRLTFGYGDLTRPILEAGAVLELAPHLVEEVKAIATSTPGARSITASEPLYAMAVAADIPKARPLLGRIGKAFAALDMACPEAELAEVAASLQQMATAPLPPALTSVRGAVISVEDVTMTEGSLPTVVDGYAALWSDDAPSLLALLSELQPLIASLELRADETPREILAGTLPFPVFATLAQHGVTVWSGDRGAARAKAALTGTAEPAPLLLVHYDYGRVIEMMAELSADDPEQDESARLLRAWAPMFGASTFELLVDDRGAVMRFKMTMR
jgi:hypothetical protein